MGWSAMKISVDANVLARAVLQDDAEQAIRAAKILKEASLIAISLPCLCELVWILLRGAQLPKEKVAQAIQALMETSKVMMNRPAVEAGLAVLAAGGGFCRWRNRL